VARCDQKHRGSKGELFGNPLSAARNPLNFSFERGCRCPQTERGQSVRTRPCWGVMKLLTLLKIYEVFSDCSDETGVMFRAPQM
jgi:hypothetical protein